MGGFEEGGGWDAPTPPNFGNANLVAGSLTLLASGPYVASSLAGSLNNEVYMGPPTGVDDTVAIQTALTSLAAGGTLIFQRGTYLVGTPGATYNATWNVAYLFLLVSNLLIRGAGKNQTLIKVVNNVPTNWDAGAVFTNDPTSQIHDLTFQDFTIDLNGANQIGTTHSNQGGLVVYNGQNIKHMRVGIKNALSAVGQEGAHFNLVGCWQVSYTECFAFKDGSNVNLGGGFSQSQCTDVELRGCRSDQMGLAAGASFGFSSFQNRHIKYVNCVATRCGISGFNCEQSEDIDYVSCQAGGKITHYQSSRTGSMPLAIDTALGNGAHGFLNQSVSNRIRYLNCSSRLNTLDGIFFGTGTGESTNVRVHGGSFIDNRYGFTFQTDNGAILTTQITGAPVLAGNTQNIYRNGIFYSLLGNTILPAADTQVSSQSVVYAAAIAPNPGLGELILVGTLTGAMTINAAVFPALGQRLSLLFTQDATGSRVVTWHSSYKTAFQPSPAANAISTVSFVYDGTNWQQTHSPAIDQNGNLTVPANLQMSGAFGQFLMLQGVGAAGFRWNLNNDGSIRLQRTPDGGATFPGTPLLVGVDQTVTLSNTLARSRQTPSEAVLVSGVDARAGELIGVTLTAARVVGAPLNPATGQRLSVTLIQSGAGAFAVTWNAAFQGITGGTSGATPTRATFAFVYDGANWNLEGAQPTWV